MEKLQPQEAVLQVPLSDRLIDLHLREDTAEMATRLLELRGNALVHLTSVVAELREAGVEPRHHVKAISQPNYWVNEVPVGRRTWVGINKNNFVNWTNRGENQEPSYVQNYKDGRRPVYERIISESMRNGNFSGFVEFVEASEDPFFASRFLAETRKKKEGPVGYAWTPERTIVRHEAERLKSNARVEQLQKALKLHGERSVETRLLDRAQAGRFTTARHLGLLVVTSARKSRKEAIQQDIVAPLTRVASMPTIEEQLVREALSSVEPVEDLTR